MDAISAMIHHLYVQKCSRCSAFILALPETTTGIFLPPPSLRQNQTGSDEKITRPNGGITPTYTWVSKPPETMPGLRLGRYLILEIIGKGGFGAVYAAYDEQLCREVAVKVPFECGLTDEELAAVSAEAQMHASLDHPNVLPIYDIGHTAEIPVFFVSKLIRGQNLSKRLEAKRLSCSEVVALVIPLARALEHLRERNLVHRDVKPRNVLLDEEEIPYLTDFGLAMNPLPLSDDEPEKLLLAGTLPYMSPEQARGEAHRVDHRSDVYSLGVVLYEMLTGEKPFRGDATTIRQKIISQPPVPPRLVDQRVPRDLDAICLKALSKSPADRYQEARQLAEDLECWQRGEPPIYANAGRLRRWRWWLWRNRQAAGWAFLALLALALIGWVSTRSPPTPIEEDPREQVTIQTNPPGATIAYFPINDLTGEPQLENVVRGKDEEIVKLLPGIYLVVAVSDEDPETFHEVFRMVPGRKHSLIGPYLHESWQFKQGVIHLPLIKLFSHDEVKVREMCLIPGCDEFETEDPTIHVVNDIPEVRRIKRRISAFYLDPTEVTNEKYKPWLEHHGKDTPPGLLIVQDPKHPASNVGWTHAVAFAEFNGKRLFDQYEYVYAATACGKHRFPWGDNDDVIKGKRWAFGPAGQPEYDCLQLPGQPKIFGLYSNVLEWTTSGPGEIPTGDPRLANLMGMRVAYGGPATLVNREEQLMTELPGVQDRQSRLTMLGMPHKNAEFPGLGFRCARSAKPRSEAKDFGRVEIDP